MTLANCTSPRRSSRSRARSLTASTSESRRMPQMAPASFPARALPTTSSPSFNHITSGGTDVGTPKVSQARRFPRPQESSPSWTRGTPFQPNVSITAAGRSFWRSQRFAKAPGRNSTQFWHRHSSTTSCAASWETAKPRDGAHVSMYPAARSRNSSACERAHAASRFSSAASNAATSSAASAAAAASSRSERVRRANTSSTVRAAS